MKSMYIAFQILEPGSGISLKIKNQYEALKSVGLDLDFCVQKLVDGKLCYVLNENTIIDDLGKGKIASLRTFYRYGQIYRYIKNKGVKYVYLRYALNATPAFLWFLKRLKKIGVHIHMEIPTYPYDGELPNDNLKHRLESLIERNSRKFFSRYIDRIVTFSSDDLIFGTPTIKISNAVNPEGIRIRTPHQHDGINMLAVAMLNFWHGYDRLIKGLHNYYCTPHSENVHLYIVGKGKVKVEYEQLVDELGLSKYVTFCGVLYGKELDEIFDLADVGIGSLGRHRNNIIQLKALKNVEYAIRGIPFVYSEQNPDFDDKPYVYKVSMDDSDICIRDIVKFVRDNECSPSEERNSVCDNLSWKTQMKKVTESFRDFD